MKKRSLTRLYGPNENFKAGSEASLLSERDKGETDISKSGGSDRNDAPLEYPKAVAFIISNEFCERFNYYGMRTILVLYLTSKLHYDDDTATVLFHIFTMLVYLCPLIGAIIADSWLGKFKTILYLSIVYAIGAVIIAIGAIPTSQLPVKEATIIGLLLIAVGTGGIKPCVSAFGGDQFRLPEQAKQLAMFFSLFYFSINAGSMISTSITPILREDVHCFGDKDCFSMAFGVPALLMLLSVVIFIAGKSLYVMKPPAGNMIFGVTKCIADAVEGWRHERHSKPRKQLLDYAEPTCGHKMVADTKLLLKILVLYLPFPVFWALFDQQGSRWTFQATRMDGETFGFMIKPDQMQVVNPLLTLAFIPLFDYVVYPIIATIGIRRPLQKLTIGGFLAAAAFLLSAFVELKLEATEPQALTLADSHLRIYNGMPCDYSFSTALPMGNGPNLATIEALGIWQNTALVTPGEASYKFKAESIDKKCPDISGELRVDPGHAISYFIADDALHEFQDSNIKPKLGNPLLRVLLNIPMFPETITLLDPADVPTGLKTYNASQVMNVLRGMSILQINGRPVANITTKSGGVYVLMVNGNDVNGYNFRTHTLTPPNSVHIMWQLPQIITITAAEIMFSVTGLEFSFTQAPLSMKSLLQGCWLLSVAIGNMLVVVIAELKFYKSQAAEFVFFAGLMVFEIFIFMLLAMRYKYVEHGEEDEPNQVEAGKTVTNGHPTGSVPHGHSNEAYIEEH